MQAKVGWKAARRAVKDFLEDDAMTLAAALAFYAGLSLAPLVVLLLWITSFLSQDTQDRIVQQATNVVGSGASDGIRMLIKNAQESPNAGTIAGIISIATLAFAATGVFAQLQRSLNLIWDVRAKGGGIVGMVVKRVVGLVMIVALLVLFVASMVATSVLTSAGQWAQGSWADNQWLWQVLEVVVSLALFIPLFALLFKFVPDVKVRWGDVWAGAAFTGVLFVLGKFLLGWYLGRGSTTSAYGAAGSFLALLLWVYYSSIVLFFGAEVTQAWANLTGTPIRPSKHAEWIPGQKPIGPETRRDREEVPGGRPRPA